MKKILTILLLLTVNSLYCLNVRPIAAAYSGVFGTILRTAQPAQRIYTQPEKITMGKGYELLNAQPSPRSEGVRNGLAATGAALCAGITSFFRPPTPAQGSGNVAARALEAMDAQHLRNKEAEEAIVTQAFKDARAASTQTNKTAHSTKVVLPSFELLPRLADGVQETLDALSEWINQILEGPQKEEFPTLE